MKRIGDKPMTQMERNKRYRDSHKLSLFAVRIDKELLDKLTTKLDNLQLTKKDFLVKAIKDFVEGH